jgi:Zn-dependent peptidase ImmA (M78 family)/transcriptional regulator with XRE-family HTH domain
MRVGIPGFIPERLVEARAARRIATKSALARLISVNPSTIGRWEDGTSAPDENAWATLSRTLNVRREFFLRPIVETQRPVFYRSLSNTLIRDLEYQHAQMRWLQEMSTTLQHYVDLPEIDIPDVLNGATYKQLCDEDIERIAIELRHHWGIGEGPCPDVVSILERIGVVVSSIEMGTAKLDGLCNWSNSDDRPHILLATDKLSFPRRQMDAAHELAHAVLHKEVSRDDLKKDLKEIEKQAFRLASAFLMPSTTYPHEAKHPSLAALLALKERWRVSIKAQIKRLSDLELITQDRATELYRLYSSKGWRSREPFDDEWAVPEPHNLADAFNAIVESGLRTKADLLAVEFTMSAGDVENLANLPPGWFSNKTGEVVQLKTTANRSDMKLGNTGEIVPFGRRYK